MPVDSGGGGNRPAAAMASRGSGGWGTGIGGSSGEGSILGQMRAGKAWEPEDRPRKQANGVQKEYIVNTRSPGKLVGDLVLSIRIPVMPQSFGDSTATYFSGLSSCQLLHRIPLPSYTDPPWPIWRV